MDKISFTKLCCFIQRLTGMTLEDDEIVELDRLTQSTKIAPNIVDELLRAMAQGEKIAAIKAYRELTGAFLKESKDAVEAPMGRSAPAPQ